MADLTGKHALITGGGTGIGAAIALAMADAGAHVTIAGRRLDVLKTHSDRHDLIKPVVGDVTDAASVQKMFLKASDLSGPVNIVVANAGAAQSAPLARTDLTLWDEMMSVNLTGTYLTFRQGLEEMKKSKWGRLVAIASTAGLKGYPYVSAYSAAKHGVIGLTRSLAVELATSNITVNAICPGFTETALLADTLKNITDKTGMSEEAARQTLASDNLLGRFVRPDEVAAAVMWLVRPGSDAITGQAISVSGGETW